MYSYSYPTVLSSDSEAEDIVPPTSAFAPTIRSMSPTANTQGQQWLPASDLKVSPPTLPGPIRQSRKIRQLQPYEPTPGKVFQPSKEKEIPKNTTQNQVNTPISVLVVPESAILSPTTTLY